MRKFKFSVFLVCFLFFVETVESQGVIAPGGLPGQMTYLPQLVAGGGYLTKIFINNLHAEPRQVRVEWFSQDGNAFLQLRAIDRNTTPIGGYVLSMPGKWVTNDRTATILTSMDGGLKIGWLRFTQPINSWGVEETSVSVTLQHVGANGQTVDASEKLNPVKASLRAAFYGNDLLGLAFCNPNDVSATVTLTRKSGGMVTLVLPPRNQVARFVSELLGKFIGGDELVELVSTVPVAVMPLQMVFDPADGLDKYQTVAVATAKDR